MTHPVRDEKKYRTSKATQIFFWRTVILEHLEQYFKAKRKKINSFKAPEREREKVKKAKRRTIVTFFVESAILLL